MVITKKELECRVMNLSSILLKTLASDPETSSELEHFLQWLESKDERELAFALAEWISDQNLKGKTSIAGAHESREASETRNKIDQLETEIIPISPLQKDMEIRIRVLSDMISQIVISDYEFSGNLEMVLNQLRSDPSKGMIRTFARWILNQSTATLNLASKHTDHGKTTPLEQQLTLLKEELVVGSAMADKKIRPTYMGEVFGDMRRVRVPVSVIHQETQHINHVDMIYVCAIPKLLQAKRIFEIGTYRGQTTCGFADVCEDAEIFTLNLPPDQDERYGEYIGSFIKTNPNKDRIHQLFSNSMTFDTAPYRNTMDFIFIDGDHSYEYVKNDTQKAFELLKPNGAIVWHDFAAKSEGVVKYLSELATQKPLMRIRDTCLVLHIDNLDFNTYEWKPLQASLEEKEYG